MGLIRFRLHDVQAKVVVVLLLLPLLPVCFVSGCVVGRLAGDD
jgi:hypothetical protein